MMPLLFGSGVITGTTQALVMLSGTLSILFIFSPTFKIFTQHQQYFKYFKLTTLIVGLPLTSIYLLLTSPENGLHFIALGMSFLIMILVVEDKQREKMLLFCLTLLFLTVMYIFKANVIIVWPLSFYWWHIFYIIGFLFVILLLRSSMRTLTLEHEKAVLSERYALARSISHDIMTPMMVLRMLLKKNSQGINDKECALMLDTLKEMGNIVDSIIPETHKDYQNLNAENLNAIVKNCILKKKVLHKSLQINLNTSEEIFARVDVLLMGRILINLINACYELLQSKNDIIDINLEKDIYQNIQIDICTNPNLPLNSLQALVKNNETLTNDLGIGIGISDFKKIITNWHGQIFLKDSNEIKYLFRIVLPNEKNDHIIGYELIDDDI